MKITALGSGGWEGIPAPFCNCRVCRLATENPKSKDNRTRPQLLMENDDQHFLIEISPDIRLQSARFTLKPLETFELAGITITPLPVYHMNKQDDTIPEDQLANTFGYLLEHDGKRVAYMADYYCVPKSVIDKIQNVDAIICDGTYLLTDDFKDHKINHLHGQDIIDFAKSTNAKQVYYHSVSHLTRKTHDEMQALLPANHYLTYDDLELNS